ncbi:hypothetical protein CK203_108966 [Vitis vinifera]|uniref:Uncharacterized protein n=1 Tax=Vitis vinifera TaxID=29760 RepID=A0A438BQ32_VITVI|nr:hypothetical protein CK203_108966 [Vitis vinifera]
MCGGDFMSKNLEEAMDFLSYVAKFSRGWDEPNAKEVGRMKAQPNDFNDKAGMAPQYTQPGQAPPQASSLEQGIVNLSKVVRDLLETRNPSMHQINLQHSISRLANLNTVQEKGKFPSQPHQNPKDIHEVEAQEGESSRLREVKAVITVRSGKEVDLPTSKPEHEPESEQRKRRGGNQRKEEMEQYKEGGP